MGLILLDLDGTLVEDAITHYLNDGTGVTVDDPAGLVKTKTKLGRRQWERYDEPALMPNVYDRLKGCAEEGDCFAIVTNQGGVAWGYHTQAEVYGRISRATAMLSMFWGAPFSVHVAFMHPKGTVPGFKGDDGRKPGDDMLAAAMTAQGMGLSETLMVGNSTDDQLAAAAAGVQFAWAFDYFGW